MKFKAAERSVFGCNVINSLEREAVETEIEHAKWLVWHGKGSKAVARLKALDARLMKRPGYECSTLWWNIQGVAGYVHNNRGLVNYARRYHKGLPISSSIAESAVNQVVSLRMAKTGRCAGQMRARICWPRCGCTKSTASCDHAPCPCHFGHPSLSTIPGGTRT